MNKKLQNLSLSLLISILFAILFQSAHSFEHLAKQFTQEHCDHKYDPSKTEFTHSHHNFDDCFVCEFSFSNYIPVEFFSFSFHQTPVAKSLMFFNSEKPIVFSGSFFSLRAPPCFIA
ncbi:hypothetical protein LZZ90_01525 [Flavobacterium sp. SM15]|uniref:hypothetical protein n=1 Tax=Flavobacterium sp. SM15 TaxID=2908005 RepID=UPI001EDA95B7|nr:hypothetical protein [Flavobacterium sp. SM15]MCG2610182.1 hypothetical protein [Flavobacterium sp. SM15]